MGQAGLVDAGQLREAGLSRWAVDRRVAGGQLHPELPGVYSLGHHSLHELAPFVAAVLWAGEDAIVSHEAAAFLWALIRRAPVTIALTLVGRHKRTVADTRLHRVDRLVTADVSLRHGIPVSSPARTLLDFAGAADDAETAAALAQARLDRLVSDRELDECLRRHPTRRGAARLRRVLDGATGASVTRSEAERVFLRLVHEAQLPVPRVNARLEGLEVDFVWPRERLVVEIDGYRFHGARPAFEEDRRRDQLLIASGYRVLRVTWRQLVGEPVAVAARLAQALAVT